MANVGIDLDASYEAFSQYHYKEAEVTHMITKITNLDGNVVGVGERSRGGSQFQPEDMSPAGYNMVNHDSETLGSHMQPLTPMGMHHG